MKIIFKKFNAVVAIAIAFSFICGAINSRAESIDFNIMQINSSRSAATKAETVPGMLVIKPRTPLSGAALNSGTSSILAGMPDLQEKLLKLNVQKVEPMFRGKQSDYSAPHDIFRILQIQIPLEVDPVQAAKELSLDPNIEYAEPIYKIQLCDIPSDSLFFRQNYLSQIHAPEAWDIQKGKKSVVIAIVDNGTDYNHKDLHDNVWKNSAEAIGLAGVDDDMNGYIDDIHGWDFGNDDADPTFISANDPHGTMMAGLTGAMTNNFFGIAGTSWNCLYMPVKGFSDSGTGTGLYQGIIYAADNGADIISNSWGHFGYTRMGQEVIDYAHSKGAIIVCAAGNYATDEPFYPAAYHHTISVASIDSNDRLTSYSNYGNWVDICAPGGERHKSLLTTTPNNGYGSGYGTSLATPLVAGVIGLVKANHAGWSSDQLVKQLLLTAKDISSVNSKHQVDMGHGRLDAWRALAINYKDVAHQNARFNLFSYQFSDATFGNGNTIFERDEIIELTIQMQNMSIIDYDRATFSIADRHGNVDFLVAEIGPMIFPADTTMQLTFLIKIKPHAAAQLTDILLTIESTYGFFSEEKLIYAIGASPLLFIDHDHSSDAPNSPDISSFYTAALTSKNIPFIYWDTNARGFPEPSFMDNFPIAMVACSYLEENILTRPERLTIRNYLDLGGHLFIAGQNIAHFLKEKQVSHEAKDFLYDYLQVDYVTNISQSNLVAGVGHDAIGENLNFQVWQPFLPADLQSPDVIKPLDATPIFVYKGGEIAGIKYSKNHRVVYLAFGLEAVDSGLNGSTTQLSATRTDVLLRSLNWLSFSDHTLPDNESAANGTVPVELRISSSIDDIQRVKLCWRIQGSSLFKQIQLTNSGGGIFKGKLSEPNGAAYIEYYFQIQTTYYDWTSPVGAPSVLHSFSNITTEAAEKDSRPSRYELMQNWPNPFNAQTKIVFELPRRSLVALLVYNARGQQIKSFITDYKPAGRHTIIWNGRDDAGNQLPSGVYFLRMTTAAFSQSRKILLIR